MDGETLTVSHSFPWHRFPVMTNVGQNIHPPNLSGPLRREGSLLYCYVALAGFLGHRKAFWLSSDLGALCPRRLGPVWIPTPSCAPHHRGSGLKPKGGVVPQAASPGHMAFEATQSHFQPCLGVSFPEPQTTRFMTLWCGFTAGWIFSFLMSGKGIKFLSSPCHFLLPLWILGHVAHLSMMF